MLGQLIKNKNNVDLSQMPQRYPLYSGLDNLKKKIAKSEGDIIKYLNLINPIDSLLNRIKFGENEDIIEKTEELLDEIGQFEIFSKNIKEIKDALKKIKRT